VIIVAELVGGVPTPAIEIEREALKKEKAAASRERLAKIEKELVNLRRNRTPRKPSGRRFAGSICQVWGTVTCLHLDSLSSRNCHAALSETRSLTIRGEAGPAALADDTAEKAASSPAPARIFLRDSIGEESNGKVFGCDPQPRVFTTYVWAYEW
jgi:hypothetical protein